MRSLSLACGLLLCTGTAGADGAPRLKLSLELGAEARVFAQGPATPGQRGGGVSVSIEPEFDLAIPRGSLRLVTFARIDQHDNERSHADLRELNIRQRYGDFDLLAGIARVFWGVTESVHLVDIINQTDLVENPDGEEKLGQPMLNLAWTTPAGVFSGFLLPWHRPRTLPGEEGRFRAPIPYGCCAQYESSAGRHRLDTAIRYSLSRGALDLGLSWFKGNAREPRFELGFNGPQPVLTPVYDVIERLGLDASAVSGGWLWKLEAVHQRSREEDFTASASGFEYTFPSVFGSSWDAGALSEFLWDSRGNDSTSPFQQDVFIGTRLAANDVAGTELLAGAIVDLDDGGVFTSIEASRRLGEAGKLTLELRLFEHTSANDPLDALRDDDYLQLGYTYFF